MLLFKRGVLIYAEQCIHISFLSSAKHKTGLILTNSLLLTSKTEIV